MLRNRSVIEVMVLTFTAVVAFSILATGATVAIVELRNPEADTDTIVQSMLSIISGILGALLGLIAGKAEATGSLGTRPDDRPDSVPDQAVRDE